MRISLSNMEDDMTWNFNRGFFKRTRWGNMTVSDTYRGKTVSYKDPMVIQGFTRVYRPGNRAYVIRTQRPGGGWIRRRWTKH